LIGRKFSTCEVPVEPRPPEDLTKSFHLSFSLPDGTRIPTTFEEAQKVFADFPVAETPKELAKIQARRMAGGYTDDDHEVGSNENEV
jgi:hypothetical protein